MDSPLNEKGFALILTLSLLPALLALAFGLAGLSYILYAQRILQHTCRTELWQAQKQFADELNALLELNPQAHSLSQQYQQALLAAETPLGPARLAGLLVRITLFNIKQKAHVLALNREPAATLQIFANRVRTRLHRHLRVAPSLSISVLRPFPTSVQPRPIDELLTAYEAVPRLEFRQQAQIKWQLDTTQLLRSFLPFAARLLGPHSSIKGTCAASVYKENTRWSSSLVQAKP